MNAATPDTYAPSRHRILVVDDEEIVVVALSETLRRERYQVVTTMDPIVALEMLAAESFSIIITDQQMPQLSGLELLAQAKQLQPDATRILITAVLSLDTVIDAINKGEVYRFVVKPWLREELLVTVKNAAQRHELVRKNAELHLAAQTMSARLAQTEKALEQQSRLAAQQAAQLVQLKTVREHQLHCSVELGLHLLDAYLPALGGQARRVRSLCLAIADGLNLPADQRQALGLAAVFHDAGLVGISRTLIARWHDHPAELSHSDWLQIEQHPVAGQKLLGFAEEFKEAGAVIRAHHERFDGQGYPDRVAGEAIPWLARLLSVAAAYESSTLPPSDALESVQHSSGAAFDPEAVRALQRALPSVPVSRQARHVTLSELRPGMVLAKGVYTANGLLLQPQDQPLTPLQIEKLLNHNRIQPITQSLVVFC
jgi:response regulator RpfG family c-di-GMP phosphodiesterase